MKGRRGGQGRQIGQQKKGGKGGRMGGRERFTFISFMQRVNSIRSPLMGVAVEECTQLVVSSQHSAVSI
jgi:hypothetical protein